MALAKDVKQDVIKKYKLSEKDSGSAEVQIAILTERINGLAPHFKANKKDHHGRYGLINMVSRRKRLLKYVQKKSDEAYKDLIARLGLRK